MRINLKRAESIKENDKRVITKFLWFPKVINHELRWLERSFYVQEVIKADVSGSYEYGVYRLVWMNVSWVDELNPLNARITINQKQGKC